MKNFAISYIFVVALYTAAAAAPPVPVQQPPPQPSKPATEQPQPTLRQTPPPHQQPAARPTPNPQTQQTIRQTTTTPQQQTKPSSTQPTKIISTPPVSVGKSPDVGQARPGSRPEVSVKPVVVDPSVKTGQHSGKLSQQIKPGASPAGTVVTTPLPPVRKDPPMITDSTLKGLDTVGKMSPGDKASPKGQQVIKEVTTKTQVTVKTLNQEIAQAETSFGLLSGKYDAAGRKTALEDIQNLKNIRNKLVVQAKTAGIDTTPTTQDITKSQKSREETKAPALSPGSPGSDYVAIMNAALASLPKDGGGLTREQKDKNAVGIEKTRPLVEAALKASDTWMETSRDNLKKLGQNWQEYLRTAGPAGVDLSFFLRNKAQEKEATNSLNESIRFRNDFIKLENSVFAAYGLPPLSSPIITTVPSDKTGPSTQPPAQNPVTKETKIWGTGTKDDPYRDYPDAKKPPDRPKYGTGNKDDPYRNEPGNYGIFKPFKETVEINNALRYVLEKKNKENVSWKDLLTQNPTLPQKEKTFLDVMKKYTEQDIKRVESMQERIWNFEFQHYGDAKSFRRIENEMVDAAFKKTLEAKQDLEKVLNFTKEVGGSFEPVNKALGDFDQEKGVYKAVSPEMLEKISAILKAGPNNYQSVKRDYFEHYEGSSTLDDLDNVKDVLHNLMTTGSFNRRSESVTVGPSFFGQSPQFQAQVIEHEYVGHALMGSDDRNMPPNKVYLPVGAAPENIEKFFRGMSGSEKITKAGDTWAYLATEAPYAVKHLEVVQTAIQSLGAAGGFPTGWEMPKNVSNQIKKNLYVSPAEALWR